MKTPMPGEWTRDDYIAAEAEWNRSERMRQVWFDAVAEATGRTDHYFCADPLKDCPACGEAMALTEKDEK